MHKLACNFCENMVLVPSAKCAEIEAQEGCF